MGPARTDRVDAVGTPRARSRVREPIGVFAAVRDRPVVPHLGFRLEPSEGSRENRGAKASLFAEAPTREGPGALRGFPGKS
jgi:hypothetical protein